MGQQNVGHALQTMLLGDDEMNVFLAEEVVIEDKKPVLRRCWLHVSLNKGHWYVGVAPFPALDKNERRRYFALKV